MNTRLFRLCARLLALIAVLLTPWAATASAPSQPPGIGITSSRSAAAPSQARVETAPRIRPLLFVSNTGQFDPRVRYQVHGAGGAWWFTDDALWLTVLERPAREQGVQPRAGRGPGARDEMQPRRGVHLRFTFPGMSPTARLVASDPQPGKTNYFLGHDASKWHSNVPTYGTLRWEGLYPGINLAFRQSGAGPGVTVETSTDAALAALQLRVEGADAVRLDATGRLVANTPIGPVALPPFLTADSKALQPVVNQNTATFTPASSNPFPVSVDDPAAPADDPTDLLYSTYLGGSDFEIPYGIALGPDNSVYVTGATYSNDFPITPGAFDPTCGSNGNCSYTSGLDDAFISRLSADGTTLIYSTYLGGNNQEVGYGIDVDADGAAYLTGYTLSGDFPITPGAFQTSCSGSCHSSDAFVTKLSADGSALVYSTYLGGVKSEVGRGITVSNDGTAYVTGNTRSSDFPVTPNAYDPTCGTDGRCNPYSFTTHSDAFVTQVNADGSGLVYSTFLGGSYDDCAHACYIALGADGSMYLAENTCSSDFPTTPGAYDTSFNGASGDCSQATDTMGDAFVTKLSADGSALVYSTFLGGTTDDWSEGLALGTDGTAYVSGETYSSDFPTTPSAYDPTCHSCPSLDGFVSRLTVDGSVLIYSTFLGGAVGMAI